MANSGYSNTPLVKKLGIKEGFVIRLVNEPVHYFDLLAGIPANVRLIKDKKKAKDLVHYFTKKLAELERDIISLRKEIFPDGAIWVSWPKKASKVETDITEDLIRDIALSNGLVDIKVCAVDEVWSALKLVVPVKDRIRNLK